MNNRNELNDKKRKKGQIKKKSNKDYSKKENMENLKIAKSSINNNDKTKKKITNHFVKKVEKPDSCKYASKCGACTYQTIAYQHELKEKQKQVDSLMRPFCKVSPIIGMDSPIHYRNKVHATFDRTKKGEIISGTYEQKSHRIIPIDNCMIDDEEADQIIYDIRNLLKSFKIKTYDEDTGFGLLRRVLVRVAQATGEIMVVLVLGSPIMPSKNNFVKALREKHPNIKTVVINVNDKKTSMILGEKEQVIYGKGYIVDKLCGISFRISPKSFYQINKKQTEVLYNTAIKMAEFSGIETVIDAYCGIGTIGMIASKKVKSVIGVELNKDAVADALVNAKMNQINNIRFYCADASKFMVDAADNNEKIDVVLMDPPRAGSDEAFLSSVIKLAPEKVVYISCNPQTLERDTQFLVKKGYVVKKVQPVDMFARTGHVEVVTCLQRVNS